MKPGRIVVGGVRGHAFRNAIIVLSGAVLIGNAQSQMATSGQFAVSESGAATYSVALPVPPGINNMEPKLALSYNSQGSNGIVGVGWNLSGLSAIGRCPRTMIEDGVRGRVSYDLNDRFCLDGQRLMVLSGQTYGGNGSEYRTEIEGFSQIKSYGSVGTAPQAGPAYFVVKTKAGLTMYYGNFDGNSGDASIAAQGQTVVRVWALKKVQDTSGDYMTFTYTNNGNASGEYYPSRIDYTGNGALAPDNSVIFGYESRQSDIIPMYQAGSLVDTTVRLKTITTQTNGGSTSASLTTLGYEESPSTYRTRLTSITQCSGNGTTCLKPVTFSWQGSAPGFDIKQGTMPNGWTFGVAGSSTPPAVYQQIIGDFDGDGITDVIEAQGSTYWVMLSDGHGGFKSVNSYQFPSALNIGNPIDHKLVIGDFDGDGNLDFLEMKGNTYYIMFNKGNGTFSPSVAYSIPNNWNFDSGDFFMEQGDLNGDGRMDILFLSGNAVYTLTSKGDGTFNAWSGALTRSSKYLTMVGQPTAIASPLPWSMIQLADVDGDGIPDLLYPDEEDPVYCGGTCPTTVGTIILHGNGDGTFAQTPSVISLSDFVPGPVDLNGDGLTDFIGGEWPCASGADMCSTLNSGATAGTFSFTYGPSPGLNGTSQYGPSGAGVAFLLTGDFNGDGRSDLVQIDHTSLQLSVSYGGGAFAQSTQSLPGDLGDYRTYLPYVFSGNQVFTGDFNGDGRTDIMAIVGSTYYQLTATGPIPDVIKTITDGLGNQTTISYSTPAQLIGNTSAPSYVRAQHTVFPIAALTPTLPLVSQVSSPNGRDATGHITLYSYGNAVSELGQVGRGFLGFAWTLSKENDTGLVNRTNYCQLFPYVGEVDTAGRGTSETNWNNLTYTQNRYSCMDFVSSSGCTMAAGSRYFVFPVEIEEQSNDWNGNAFYPLPRKRTIQQYDAWGNVLNMREETLQPDNVDSNGVSTTGFAAYVATGFSKAVSNNYATADTTNWFLGRLLRSTATSRDDDATLTDTSTTSMRCPSLSNQFISTKTGPSSASGMATAQSVRQPNLAH